MDAQQQKELRFIRLEQVKKLTGLGRSSIYGLPAFPAPVRIVGSRCVAWIESEVLDFMHQAIAARNAALPVQEKATLESVPLPPAPATSGWATGVSAASEMAGGVSRE